MANIINPNTGSYALEADGYGLIGRYETVAGALHVATESKFAGFQITSGGQLIMTEVDAN